MGPICDDLAAEHEALDVLVAGLDEEGWSQETPAEGWSVRDTISHLAYFDEKAVLAALDPDAFAEHVKDVTAKGAAAMDEQLALGRSMSGAELLAWWRKARTEGLEELRRLDPSARIPWYGPAMGARSFATARLMETWAHGQDVSDGVGIQRAPTDRLKHVAHIGVRALPWSFVVRALEPPTEAVRVELQSPSGETWTWGDDALPDRVVGDALEFCLVVTQRRHLDDTNLLIEGPVANAWMPIAQAFAGPPGKGRAPLKG
jgi:uncharacterized protein (TIGR03084 family)